MTLAMPTPTYSIQLSTTFRAVVVALGSGIKGQLGVDVVDVLGHLPHNGVLVWACMAAFVSRVSALAEA